MRFKFPLVLPDTSLEALDVGEQIAYCARNERRQTLQMHSSSTTNLDSSLRQNDPKLGE